MLTQAYTEALYLLQSAQTKNAKKRLERIPGISRRDAGKLIRMMIQETPKDASAERYRPSADDRLLGKLATEALVNKGDFMRALSLLREHRRLPLADCFAWLDDIQQEHGSHPKGEWVHAKRSMVITSLLVAFMVAGLVFSWMATSSYLDHERRIGQGEPATGRVVEVITGTPQSGTRVQYAPVIDYSWKGQPMTYTGDFSRGIFVLHEGEEVPIYINPDNPREIVIDTFGERWSKPGILGLLGLACIFFPAMVLYVLRPRKYLQRHDIHTRSKRETHRVS